MTSFRLPEIGRAQRKRATSAIAAAIALVSIGACGGGEGDAASTSTVDRTVDVTATEYSFAGDPGRLVAGETIRFVVSNTGVLDHSMEVLDSTGRRLGKTGRIVPGSTDETTVTFESAGAYRLICDIDDHLSRGQSAGLTVADS